MFKLVAWFREWLKWWRIERAERLVKRYGYAVYLYEYVASAEERATALAAYAVRSGHLTRAFHAGKWVQRDAADIVGLLGAARSVVVLRGRGGLEHIGYVLVGLLGRMLTQGGARSW